MARLIGIFLAVLELIRNHGLGLELGDESGDIWLVQLPELPPEGQEEASSDQSG